MQGEGGRFSSRCHPLRGGGGETREQINEHREGRGKGQGKQRRGKIGAKAYIQINTTHS